MNKLEKLFQDYKGEIPKLDKETEDFIRELDKPVGKEFDWNKEKDYSSQCPICSDKLYETYEINDDAIAGEDPRAYGVICSNCSYESYD